MANQPSPQKQIIGARISRVVYKKCEVLAKKHNITLSDLLAMVLERETRNIELTPEQYEEIAAEIRRARSGQNPRRERNSKKNSKHVESE